MRTHHVPARCRARIALSCNLQPLATLPRLIAPALVAALVAGCGSPAATLGTVAKIALNASGLTAPELPESQKPPRKVPMSIDAGRNLNADGRGQPLAVVVRIYKLKDTTAFYQAPFEAFVAAGRDKEVLGDALVESREITLIPGQPFNWTETVPRAAGAVGIVALFHSPGPQRWRFAFDAVAAEKSGIAMGAHACALTVTKGAVLPMQSSQTSGPAPNYNQLVQVNCKT